MPDPLTRAPLTRGPTSPHGRGEEAACARLTRVQIVAAARRWVGTPYHHQAGLKGVGTDCLGLIRGVYGEVTGRASEAPPPYTPDWAEAQRRETLIEAAGRYLVPVARDRAGAGDVVLFRIRQGAMAKHAAILTGPERMIHACSGRVVAEVHLGTWWRRRLVAAFAFPGVGEE